MASAEFSILTPERVSLQYDIAGVGSRGAAVMIDTAVQAVALLVVFVAYAAAIAATDTGQGGEPLALAVAALLGFAITNGYFIVFEIVWSGQTPGKRLVGVRVIRENGYPVRPIDAVIRNVVRLVDWLPFLYATGIVVMLLNGRSRRLGDFASGTIVVREGSRVLNTLAPLAPPARQGVALASADATLVRDFLVRRASLSPAARAALAQRLATALAQRYGLPLDLEAEAERFLEQLAA